MLTEPRQESEGVSSGGLVERVLALFLGGLLWWLICGRTLSLEGGASLQAGEWGLYVFPLLVLVLSVGFGAGRVALIAFPTVLVVALGHIASADLVELSGFRGSVAVAASLVGFLFVASRWAASQEGTSDWQGSKGEALGGQATRASMWWWWPRIVLMMAIFFVPLHALFGESGRTQLVETFADKAMSMRILILVFHALTTVFVAQLAFFAPAARLDYEQWQLEQSYRKAFAEEVLLRARWVIGGAIVVGLGVMTAYLWLI